MGKTMIIVAGLLLCLPASARCEDPKPYVVMLAGNVADLWTTQAALASGLAHEGNPSLNHQGIGTIAAAKIAGMVAMTGIMHTLTTHGHPRLAKVLGYVDGGVTFAAATHNWRVVRR